MEDCQQIADEALRLTDYTVTGGKLLSDSTGLESWIEYLARINGTQPSEHCPDVASTQ